MALVPFFLPIPHSTNAGEKEGEVLDTVAWHVFLKGKAVTGHVDLHRYPISHNSYLAPLRNTGDCRHINTANVDMQVEASNDSVTLHQY